MTKILQYTALITLMFAPAGAFGKTASGLGDQFIIGAKACINILAGKLSLNPPSPAQAAAGLLLADPSAPDELVPFADLSPRTRLFAAVASGDGHVVIGFDPSQKLCRVVVQHVTDIAPVTAAVGPLGGDWKVISDDPQKNFSVYAGTLLGSSTLTIRLRQPSGTTYGSANYMMTLIGK